LGSHPQVALPQENSLTCTSTSPTTSVHDSRYVTGPRLCIGPQNHLQGSTLLHRTISAHFSTKLWKICT
jgi:hypothetical protein